MKISPGVVPPGGWVYKQGIFKIPGEDFKDLIKNVREHRMSNKLIVGDVQGDVENQIANLHPHLVIGD